jgi:hypothetical protein
MNKFGMLLALTLTVLASPAVAVTIPCSTETDGSFRCTLAEPPESSGVEVSSGTLITPRNRVINGTLILCDANNNDMPCPPDQQSDVVTWDGRSGSLVMTICSDSESGPIHCSPLPIGPTVYRDEVEKPPPASGDGVVYTPQSGSDPGFEALSEITYVISSDVVPEPSSIWMSLSAFAFLIFVAAHRRMG